MSRDVNFGGSMPLESRKSWRMHTRVEDFASSAFGAEEDEPYQHRHDGVTRATRKEFLIQESSVAIDVEPPSTTSGILRFLRLMSHKFLFMWITLFVGSLVVSLMANQCGLGLGWHDAVIPGVMTVIIVVYTGCLVIFQLEVFKRMKDATNSLMKQKEQLLPVILRTDLCEARDQSDHQTVPAVTDLAFFMGCHKTPRSLSFKARNNSSSTGETQPCFMEGSGYYYLPTRMQSLSHFQLLKNFYGDYLNLGGPCGCMQGLTMVIGIIQVWESAANAVQPGVLRGCRGAEDDGVFLGLVHTASLSFFGLGVLGVIQFRNVRWLMKNALGTATGEKEWLAYDLLQGDQKESSFLSAIDTAEDGVWNSVDRSGLQSKSLSQVARHHKYKGHLNLTYAWMCAAAAAESFGATYLAEMCDHIASQTKEMVESSSNYKFKLKQMAEWDIKKGSIICRLVQAFLLVFTSSELCGTTSMLSEGRRKSVLHIWAFATVCVVLGCCTAAWKALAAAKYWRSQDTVLAGRSAEVSATICFTTALAAATWLCAIFGLLMRYIHCYHGGFSLLAPLRNGLPRCSAIGVESGY